MLLAQFTRVDRFEASIFPDTLTFGLVTPDIYDSRTSDKQRSHLVSHRVYIRRILIDKFSSFIDVDSRFENAVILT